MDPLRILVRVLFAYFWVLALVRATGRRTVKQGDIPSFVLALIIGDMSDDLFWAEVSAAQFVAGVGTLAFVHLWATIGRSGAGRRAWRRSSTRARG
jgi:uncharacterized membrane protein YcaP (DUF421 family)